MAVKHGIYLERVKSLGTFPNINKLNDKEAAIFISDRFMSPDNESIYVSVNNGISWRKMNLGKYKTIIQQRHALKKQHFIAKLWVALLKAMMEGKDGLLHIFFW